MTKDEAMKMETRQTRLTVAPEGDPIFSEGGFAVEIDDEGGGEFVVVTDYAGPYGGKIGIGPSQWPALRAAIDQMVGECREGGA